jgi:hypothetical protein
MGLVVVHLTPSPRRRGPKLTRPPRRGPKLTCPRTTTTVAPDGDPSILFGADDSDIRLPPSREQGSMGLVVVRGSGETFTIFSCRINKILKIAVISALMGNCAGIQSTARSMRCAGLGPRPALGRRSF